MSSRHNTKVALGRRINVAGSVIRILSQGRSVRFSNISVRAAMAQVFNSHLCRSRNAIQIVMMPFVPTHTCMR